MQTSEALARAEVASCKATHESAVATFTHQLTTGTATRKQQAEYIEQLRREHQTAQQGLDNCTRTAQILQQRLETSQNNKTDLQETVKSLSENLAKQTAELEQLKRRNRMLEDEHS